MVLALVRPFSLEMVSIVRVSTPQRGWAEKPPHACGDPNAILQDRRYSIKEGTLTQSGNWILRIKIQIWALVKIIMLAFIYDTIYVYFCMDNANWWLW